MNYREQYEKQTGKQAVVDGIIITEYAEWLESLLKDKDELIETYTEYVVWCGERLYTYDCFDRKNPKQLREKIKTLKSKTI